MLCKKRLVPCASLIAISWGLAYAELPPTTKEIDARVDAMANRGIEFLRARGQADDGSFSGNTGAAVTGLVTRSILEHRPASANTDLVVQKALAFLESMIQSDGGIYAVGSKYRNYETSTAVLAMLAAQPAFAESDSDRHSRYDSVLNRAEAFLKDIQWDEGEGVSPDEPAYGGSGYGSHSRPDLSNTSFLIEALRELGNGPDDESIQKALMFVARTQNLSGHGNNTPHAEKIDDGGFYYTPAAGGQTKAGETANGGLRSYGSMTYAGLKSFIYAGLSRDDPRVAAAMSFITETYTLDSNPGMGPQGLYYYYHTFAKALDVAGIEVLDDANGQSHDWRLDLVKKLEATQQADGSWVNRDSERWMEGDRQLVTAYCLMALARVKQGPSGPILRSEQ